MYIYIYLDMETGTACFLIQHRPTEEQPCTPNTMCDQHARYRARNVITGGLLVAKVQVYSTLVSPERRLVESQPLPLSPPPLPPLPLPPPPLTPPLLPPNAADTLETRSRKNACLRRPNGLLSALKDTKTLQMEPFLGAVEINFRRP